MKDVRFGMVLPLLLLAGCGAADQFGSTGATVYGSEIVYVGTVSYSGSQYTDCSIATSSDTTRAFLTCPSIPIAVTFDNQTVPYLQSTNSLQLYSGDPAGVGQLPFRSTGSATVVQQGKNVMVELLLGDSGAASATLHDSLVTVISTMPAQFAGPWTAD